MNYWQGKHVRLRGIEPSDGPTFFEWNLDSEMARSLDFVWPPVSQVEVSRWVDQQSRKKLEDGTFSWVIEDASGAPVGAISTRDCNPRNGTFSYGIHVAREHRRKGYAVEAISLVLKYYFEELRYQKATVPVHSFNDASVALHEKLGFAKEGTLRRMIYSGGEYHDEHWYGLTKEELAESSMKA